jgi:membrane protein DedA with SNARE-associated domain
LRDIFWGVRAQIFLVSGVMKMSTTKFLVADAISALFTIGLWGGVSNLGGNSVQALKKDITRVEHIAIVVFVILIASGIIFWYLVLCLRNTLTKSFDLFEN